MQFHISYGEIQSLVYNKTSKTIVFSYDSRHTVRVGYDVTVLFKTSNVGLDISIESVSNSEVLVSYGGGAGIQFMVKQALDHAKNRPGMDMIEATDGGKLLFHLDKNPQLRQLLDHITLQDIFFDEHDVIIEFAPKSL